MNNCFIILAAGESKRFNSKLAKPYHLYRGKPLFLHSIDKVKNHKKIQMILLVINKRHKKFTKELKIKNLKIIEGGKTRADSAFKALKDIKKKNIKNVLIHDAARPNFSVKLLNKIIKKLENSYCVIPAIRPNDSVKYKNKKKIENLERSKTYLTQTPQGFRYSKLYELQINRSVNVTDDANLFIAANKKIKFIDGEIQNYKITTESDIKINNNMRYGIGFDVHRLVANKKLYLGGIKIPHPFGTLGHSDGDPVLHAITDAILGACQKRDIGYKFSDKDIKFKNIRSTILLTKVIEEIKLKGFIVNNIDINIITQKPKLQKYNKKILSSIAKLCEISTSQINIKGKTTEKLGVIGREKAIACEVIASVIRYD